MKEGSIRWTIERIKWAAYAVPRVDEHSMGQSTNEVPDPEWLDWPNTQWVCPSVDRSMDQPSVHPAMHTFNTSSFTHDSLAPPLRGPVGGEARRPAEPAAGPPGGVRMGVQGRANIKNIPAVGFDLTTYSFSKRCIALWLLWRLISKLSNKASELLKIYSCCWGGWGVRERGNIKNWLAVGFDLTT